MLHTIETTAKMCRLPAIPVHNWIPQAALGLAGLNDHSISAVLLGKITPQTNLIRTISTKLSRSHRTKQNLLSNSPPQTRAITGQTLYQMQDQLDRLTTLGFDLPAQTLERGLVAPLFLLSPQWKRTPIGEPFAEQPRDHGQHSIQQSPVISIIPFCQDHPGLVLVCILARDTETDSTFSHNSHGYSGGNGHEDNEGVDQLVETMRKLMPILAFKAKMALSHVLDPKAWLTDREREILDLLIRGESVRVIAEQLGRSSHTVHDHVKNLHRKLGASSRGELIAKALGYMPEDLNCMSMLPDPITLMGTSSLAELKATRSSATSLTSSQAL